MQCSIENKTGVEVSLVHFSGGTLVGCPGIPPNSRQAVTVKPGDVLGYRGKKITIQSSHDGAAIYWPDSFS